MGHRAVERRGRPAGRISTDSRSVKSVSRGFQCFLRLASSSSDSLTSMRALVGVDRDDVAVAQKRDRAADRRLRPDMADAEAARRAGEAPVGDQRDLVAHALAVKRRGGRQHLAHAGAAARALVADDEHVAFLVVLVLHRLEAGLLAVEAARRAGELQVRHAGDLHDRAFGREVALEADDAAGRGERLVGRAHDVLVRVPLHRLPCSRRWCGR